MGPALFARRLLSGDEPSGDWALSAEVGGGSTYPGPPSGSLWVVPMPPRSPAATRCRLDPVSLLSTSVRAPVAVRDGLWFVFRGGVHVGGGIGHSSVASRQACAEQGLAGRGSSLALDSRRFRKRRTDLYSTLGWTGGLIDFGPDLDARLRLRGGEHVGLGFFFRHDQLFTDIKPDQYHFKLIWRPARVSQQPAQL